MRQGIGKWMVVAALAALLAACGGKDGGDPAAVTVGADGGSVAGDGGVKVIVPPGAMAQDVTVRVAQDATGAPALPGWSPAAGPMVAITPHGAEFNEPVTVRLPVPAGLQLQDNQRLLIAKAQPGGEWEVLGDTVTRNGQLEVAVRSFSYFAPVVVTYVPVTGVTVLPQPYGFSSITLTCDGAPCANPELLRRIPMSITVTPNGGLLPASCVDPKIGLWQNGVVGGINIGQPEPASSGMVFTRGFTLDTARLRQSPLEALFSVRLICTDATTNARSYLVGAEATLHLRGPDTIHRVPQVVQFPDAVQLATGEGLALRGVLTGGASIRSGTNYLAPTPTDQAWVYLERKDSSDTVWRTVRTRSQSEANASPLAGSLPWAFWGYDFDLGAATAADNGAQFRLRACYRLPTATAEACNIGPLATLTVVQQTVAPAFTQQPRALLVQPGQTASFSVVAGGTPAPALQWQTRPANGTGDWVDVADGSGATTANYTTPVLQLADNGRQYRVLASNAAGSTPSETVTVSVADGLVAPTITSQPAALTVLAGSEAVFAVTVNGTGPLSYQWFFGDVALSGANGPQLKIANAGAAQRGLYSVRVSNGAGSVLSDRVALTVTDVPSGTAPVAPAIATQPAAVAVTVGNTATFGVGVTGTGPFTFQWRRNEVDIAGATAAAYTIQGVTTADAGNYSVVVSNGVGTVTSRAATLGVAPALTPASATPEAPSINAQPQPMVVAPGLSVALAVGTQGSGPLAYQWSRNGTPLAGQTGAQLLIAAATAGDAGSYQVTVSNAAGSVASNAVALTVIGAPVISAQPGAASAAVGSTATFGVTASGEALRYQWLRNGLPIGSATEASYTTPALALADSGAVYSVAVFNGAGLVISQGALLTVDAPAATAAVDGKIAIGSYHGCAVAAAGTLYCWGAGAAGALGDGTGLTRAEPTLVSGLTEVSAVSAGLASTCAIHGAARTLSCWGQATGGATTPQRMVAADVQAVAVNWVHGCLIDGTGGRNAVACWGQNASGQLGNGSTEEAASPQAVRFADGNPFEGAVAVVVGVNFSCAQRANGEVWCWGADVFVNARTAPERVRKLDLDGVESDFLARGGLVAGGQHACVFEVGNDQPMCWGFNPAGQLGDNTTNGRNQARPASIYGSLRLFAGVHHTCAVRATDMLCWGTGYMGNHAAQEQLLYPQTAGRPNSLREVADPVIAGGAGAGHTCVLRANGNVMCWGANDVGQVGTGAAQVSAGAVVATPTSTTLGAAFWKP